MENEKDFVRDRLLPFAVGLGVTVALSIIYVLLWIFSAALVAVGSVGAPGSAIGLFFAAPLWLVIIAANFALWVLTTWLLGKWTQEKYRGYKHKQAQKRAEDEFYRREAWFAEKQRQEEQEKQARQEAEWEKEWNLKKQEKENSLSEKPEKSKSALTDTPPAESSGSQEEKQ